MGHVQWLLNNEGSISQWIMVASCSRDISAYNACEGSSSEKVHRDMQLGPKLMALVENSQVI